MYADMFFTLRNHVEWQTECKINIAPPDPLILALEKDREKLNVKMERCCSACDIGERCLRLKNSNQENRLENYVSQVPLRGAPSVPVLSDIDKEEEIAVTGKKRQIHIQS